MNGRICAIAALLAAFLVFAHVPQAQLTTSPSPYSWSNSSVDVGQSSFGSTVVSGGLGPYSANWVINAPSSSGLSATITSTGALGASNSLNISVSSITGTGVTFTFLGTPYSLSTSGSNTVFGTWTIYAKVSDSGANTLQTSSSALTISNTLGAPAAPTVKGAVLDVGQQQTFTTFAIGGTSPLTYNFIVSNTVTGAVTHVSGPQNSNTFVYITTSTASKQANVIVTDSATTKQTTVSSYSVSFTTNPAPTFTALTPSNSVLLNGNYVTFTTSLSGGTGPFIANLVASNGMVVNTVSLSSPGSITFPAFVPSPRTQSFNVIATDLGTTIPYTFNSASSSITIIAPTLPVTSNRTSVLVGHSVLITATPNNGVGPYNLTLMYTNNNTKASSTLQNVQNGQTKDFIFTPSSANTFTMYVVGVDTGEKYYQFNSSIMTITSSNSLGATSTTTISSGGGGSSTISTTTKNTTSTTSATTTIPTPSNIVVPSNTPVNANFTYVNVYLVLRTSSSSAQNVIVNASNVTGSVPVPPKGFQNLDAVSVNVTGFSNLTVNITMKYPCSISSSNISPFILKNGAWQAILIYTVNAASCTVKFTIPKDPVVAIFESTSPTMTTSNSTSTTSEAQKLVVPPPNDTGVIILVIVIVVVAAVILFFQLRGKSRGPVPPQQTQSRRQQRNF